MDEGAIVICNLRRPAHFVDALITPMIAQMALSCADDGRVPSGPSEWKTPNDLGSCTGHKRDIGPMSED
jgi:hypothetical protein